MVFSILISSVGLSAHPPLPPHWRLGSPEMQEYQKIRVAVLVWGPALQVPQGPTCSGVDPSLVCQPQAWATNPRACKAGPLQFYIFLSRIKSIQEVKFTCGKMISFILINFLSQSLFMDYVEVCGFSLLLRYMY